MNQYGTVKNHLIELIEKRGLSKTKVMQRAELQPAQLNKYCKNQVTRFDADVLARLCTVLECEIGDLLEFVPPSSEETQN